MGTWPLGITQKGDAPVASPSLQSTPTLATDIHPVRMTREMARRFLLFLAANGGVQNATDYVSIDDLWLALGEDA